MKLGIRSSNHSTILCALGFLLVVFTLSPGRILSSDAGIRASVARKLWSEGTVFFPAGTKIDYGLVGKTPDQMTTYFGIGQSLVFIPFDMLGRLLSHLPNLPANLVGYVETLPIVFLYIPAVALVWWFGMLQMFKTFQARSPEMLATLFFACTIAGVYVTQTAQEESWIGACLALAFVALLNERREANLARASLLGFLTALPLLFRATSVFAVFPSLVVLVEPYLPSSNSTKRSLRADARFLLAFAFGFACLLSVHFVFAKWRFGSFLSTGYDLVMARSNWGMDSPNPKLLFGFLFGFGKGLFVLSPIFLLAPIGLVQLIRERPWIWSGVGLGFVANLVLHSKLRVDPDGSECWGCRYQIHWLTFLAVPAWRGWELLRHRLGQRVAGVLVMFLLTAGGLFQLAGTFAPDSTEYTQSDTRGNPRRELIFGLKEGQLALRLRNIAMWALGRPLASDADAAKREDIEYYARRYFPNYWGYTWSEFLSPHLAKTLFAIWFLIGTVGLALVVRNLWVLQKTKRDSQTESAAVSQPLPARRAHMLR